MTASTRMKQRPSMSVSLRKRVDRTGTNGSDFRRKASCTGETCGGCGWGSDLPSVGSRGSAQAGTKRPGEVGLVVEAGFQGNVRERASAVSHRLDRSRQSQPAHVLADGPVKTLSKHASQVHGVHTDVVGQCGDVKWLVRTRMQSIEEPSKPRRLGAAGIAIWRARVAA